jgi:hypothetical protein
MDKVVDGDTQWIPLLYAFSLLFTHSVIFLSSFLDPSKHSNTYHAINITLYSVRVCGQGGLKFEIVVSGEVDKVIHVWGK